MTVLIGSRQPESLSGIKVDSPEWFAWLEEQKSFRFECSYTWHIQAGIADIKSATCTVIKQGKYWNAQKRVSGQLRRYYLGMSDKLTYDGLCEAAKTLTINSKWCDYLRAKQSPSPQSHKKEIDSCETENQDTYQTSDLQARLAELEKENEQLKARINDLQFLELKVAGYESSMREMHEELLSRPHPADLIRRKIAELGMQEKIMQHQRDPKTNARYWALAKLLEAIE